MESRVFTYQARIKYEGVFNFLNDSACLFSRLERKLFAAYQVEEDKNYLKRNFLKQYGISSRMYNAIRISLDGKIKSYLDRLKAHVLTVETRLAKKKRLLKNLENPKKTKTNLSKKKPTKNGKPPKTTRKIGKIIGCRIFNYMFT